MRNSAESILRESYSLNKLHYKKAARVMHCKVLFIRSGFTHVHVNVTIVTDCCQVL